jgi:hypothetical protein
MELSLAFLNIGKFINSDLMVNKKFSAEPIAYFPFTVTLVTRYEK